MITSRPKRIAILVGSFGGGLLLWYVVQQATIAVFGPAYYGDRQDFEFAAVYVTIVLPVLLLIEIVAWIRERRAMSHRRHDAQDPVHDPGSAASDSLRKPPC
jgi:hypothetical protein